MSKIEYSDLLFEISKKLDENELPRLIFMCREEIAEGSEESIRDVLTLFKELEKQNRLGIDRLDTLKEILKQMKKRSLLKKVEEFEIRRKAQSVGIVSSLKRVATSIKGAVKLVCNLRTIAGGLLVVSSGMALRRCSSLDEFVEVFNKVILVSYSKLVEISEGSLCFTVQAETSSALKELWDMYKSGTLQNRLQEFLVTDEIEQLASGEDVEVTVYIDEQEYNTAYLDLMLLQKQESDVTEEERLGGRRRRNSDSFLCVKPNEDDATLMKLKLAENNWNLERQRRQFLEEENNNLRAKTAVKRRLVFQEEESAQGTQDLERPRKRRRRNSDSSLYCKARDETTAQSEEGAETKHLDSDKYEFVQSYLQNIQETHSMTTETSDSGITTHGEPSDVKMQDISDRPFQLCLKDLSKDVIRKLNVRLAADQVASRHIYKSFGIKHAFDRSMSIFELFPDTPVKLFEDVLGALQLYDLVELLEKPRKPRPVRSLRAALPLQKIEKLRNTVDLRPTTYHSNVAVLIITNKKNNHTEGIESFFKGFSSKSDVTVFEWKTQTYHGAQSELVKGRVSSAPSRLSWHRLPNEPDLGRKQQEAQKEMETNATAVSAVIERWIHNQGNFSLFAVFVFVTEYLLIGFERDWAAIMKRLVSGIPHKIKFLVGSGISISVPESSESLVVTNRYGGIVPQLDRLMLDILNKRWQTLDLISMLGELKRSTSEDFNRLGSQTKESLFWRNRKVLYVTDRLSSRPRFKK